MSAEQATTNKSEATKKTAKKTARKKKRIMKQPQMLRMIYALIPVLLTAIYFFGWVALAITVVATLAGLATEYITSSKRNQPVSTALFVTCLLYALSLPATTPMWVVAVGAVVAVLFGKEVYGGFGRNWVNPAIVGRAFVYICFPGDLTNRFVPAFKGFPGGFAHWSFRSLSQLPEYLRDTGQSVADAVGQASPMWVSGKYGFDVVRNVQDGSAQGASLWDMLLGSIGGTFNVPGETGSRILYAGSLGEGAGLVIIAAGIYLLVTKTAFWRLMIPGLIGVVVANVLFRNILGYDGVGEVPPVAWQLLSGTTLYAAVFMITEPVSAPKQDSARIAYGFLIGFLVVFLRWQGPFVAAATFSILLGNMVAPLLDLGAQAWQDRRKRKAAGAEGDR